MQDRTINSALLNLRRDIIRGDGVGLDHVEALLVQRGIHMPMVRPKWGPRAGKGIMARMALDALADGPLTARQVTEYIAEQRPELGYDQAHRLTATALTKLKWRGLVGKEDRLGGLWRVWDSQMC